jgi:hypothetical protein
MSRGGSNRSGSWTQALLIPIRPIFALAFVACASGVVAASGICISVEVESPIRLPDGTVHEAGGLTLCDDRSLTPVTSLHRTLVNGHPVGLLLGRKARSEGGGELSPVVFFSRDDEGRMELFGYALPARGGSVTYLLNENRRIARKQSEIASSARDSRPLIVMAARPR